MGERAAVEKFEVVLELEPEPGSRTDPFRFGHFWREVPETLHIGAYPAYSLWRDR